MALAPHVYDYTRNIGRQGGPTMGPVRRAVDVLGKAALLAGGLAGAAYLGSKYSPDGNDGGSGGGGAMAMPTPKQDAEKVVEEVTTSPIVETAGPSEESVRFAREKARGMGRAELISQQEKKASFRRASAQLGSEVVGAEPPIPGAADPYALREVMAHLESQGRVVIPTTTTRVPTSFGKLELDNEPAVGLTVAEALPDLTSQVARVSGDVTPATTSQRFGQPVVPDQTSLAQAVKGTSSFKPTLGAIEQKPVTQSELIATGQHFSPGTELQQAAQRTEEKLGASPIAAMARRHTAESMEDEMLARRAFGNMPLDQAMDLLAKARAAKAGAVTAPPQSQTISVKEQSPITGIQTSPSLDVASALKSKGLSLSGDPSTGEITVNTEKGESYLIDHPYSNHPKAGIRQTALQEEQLARDLLSSAGVTPDQAKTHWSSKFSESTPAKIVTERPTYPVRVSEEVTVPAAKVSANEFLSEMSQRLGPLATYSIAPQRSPGVKSLAFYPGGEVGVQMRHGGGGESAYATADPYRLALSDYAEEGFPTGMGKIGGIVSRSGTGPQLGVQQRLTPGGIISEDQPEHAGLMSAREIAKKLTSKSQRTREQAEYHAETKNIMQALEERAAARRAGVM